MSSGPATATKYKAEIDGLRALAVLSVVWFHAFPESLTGGFTGVDVFFVISGYLITSHIFVSLEAREFSFLDFFSRRIRRLFPALLFVMASSLVFGWFALAWYELNLLGKHIASGGAFIVNFVLVNESGYFDTAADAKPMLHLWSLAVEEQFYLLWPLVLWLTWRLNFSLLAITLFVAVISFAFNVRNSATLPTEVFFWPFGRFWELLAGSVLGWLMIYRWETIENFKLKFDTKVQSIWPLVELRRRVFFADNALSLAGLGLLVFGFFTINSDLKFPFYWALIPVAGALLIIAGGQNGWTNKVLIMNRPAVWFGLISYPLYLWHWPILSFLFITNGGVVPHRDQRIIAVVLSVILAWLTMKFVERPLRFGRQNVTEKVIGLVAAMACVSLLGLQLSRSDLSESHSFDQLPIQRPDTQFIFGPSASWIPGKDGWLFLGNAHERTIEKLLLAKRPSPEDLASETQVFSDITAAAMETNTDVALIIGPNKSTIYPEFLPDEISPAPSRYISSFIDQLRNTPNLVVIDPKTKIVSAKSGPLPVYHPTDTHWNAIGAFQAFAQAAEQLGWPVPTLRFSVGVPFIGDLIGVGQLESTEFARSHRVSIEWEREPVLEIRALARQPETSFGRSEVVFNEDAPILKTVWVIGDSFTNALTPYFDATFSEVHYLGHWSEKAGVLPADILAAEEKPDLVIVVRVERSF